MNAQVFIYFAHLKFQLKSALTKTGISRLKFGHGRIFEYNPMSEAEMCSMVFFKSQRHLMADWLNETFDDLVPDEIDDFFKRFEKIHPKIRVTNISESDLMWATDGNCCEINSPLFANPVKLTDDQEAMLIRTIINKRVEPDYKFMMGDSVNLEEALERYFAWHCQRYGISVEDKERIDEQEVELVWHFCNMHGFDWFAVCNTNLIQDKIHEPPKPKMTEAEREEALNKLCDEFRVKNRIRKKPSIGKTGKNKAGIGSEIADCGSHAMAIGFWGALISLALLLIVRMLIFIGSLS